LPSIASAASAGYKFTDVDVNGIDMAKSPVVYVERNGNVQVKVDLEALGAVDGVKVKAWIGGYEYGDIKATTSLFDVEAGVTYPVLLAFGIPSDIDASKEYTLHIEAYDKDNQYEQEYVLRVKEKRHLVEIQDVIFNPGLTVKNTEPLFVVVRLENMGDKKEEDIKVEVSIPALGISQRTYVDELTKTDEDEDESSDSTDALYLDLSDVNPGIYKLRVTAEYNKGYDVNGIEYNLVVEGSSPFSTEGSVLVGTTPRSVVAQEESTAAYTVSVANLGEKAVVLQAELTGVDGWASSTMEPSLVVVPSGSKSDIEIKVTPNKNTQGKHQFLLLLKDNEGRLVKQVGFETVVKGKASGAWGSIKTGLEIAFIVLLVIAIILAVVISIQKASKKEGEEETSSESPSIDSQFAPEPATYY
jgi:hypothetical protein